MFLCKVRKNLQNLLKYVLKCLTQYAVYTCMCSSMQKLFNRLCCSENVQNYLKIAVVYVKICEDMQIFAFFGICKLGNSIIYSKQIFARRMISVVISCSHVTVSLFIDLQ